MTEKEKIDAWMPLWIGAYLADTMMLNTQQHGAYLLLLIAYWRNGGPLPDDDDDLATIVRATLSDWKKLRPKLARFFVVADGQWSHGRADRELCDAKERRVAAVEKAKQAANKRWGNARSTASGNTSGNGPSMPRALPEQCPTPSPSPIPSECGSNEPPRPPAKPDGYTVGFEQAWREYPHRTGHSKAEAFKAWKSRIAAGEDGQTMLAGVARYAAYCQAERTKARFVKHASTFFGVDRHYLNDWTPTSRAVTAVSRRTTNNERLSAWLADITNPTHGEKHDDRTVDAESRFV